MQAIPTDTTMPPAPPITGDALILSLAAAYREADAAVTVFDEESVRHPETIAHHLANSREAHTYRRDAIEEAIISIPATGLPGAMAQIEVLFLMNEAGTNERTDEMTRIALWSIFGVLARAIGRTERDGIEVMRPDRNAFRTDVAALVAEWRSGLRSVGVAA
jgi:hypothetical protein